jgi:hypothetical protein
MAQQFITVALISREFLTVSNKYRQKAMPEPNFFCLHLIGQE